jgi:hypothetical protein
MKLLILSKFEMKNDCMCSHKQIVYKNTFVMHPFTPETENITTCLIF